MEVSIILCVAVVLGYSLIIAIESFKGDFIFKNDFEGYSIKTHKSMEYLCKVLFDIALCKNYSVEFFSVEKGEFLLSQRTSLFHGGIFYPIKTRPNENDEIEIVIGAKSRLVFAGILIFKNHRNFFNLVKLGLQ